MSSKSQPCVGPWSALVALLAAIFVLAVIYMAQASVAVNQRNKLLAKWNDWQSHLLKIRHELASARQLRASLQSLVGHRGRVMLQGSAATGALQDTSDIDIKIHAKGCQEFSEIADVLQRSNLRHAFSGGTYALFVGQTETGRLADVSLSVEEADTSSHHPMPEHKLEERGFLEFIIRQKRPDTSIRRSKINNE